jgi:hypothetical protein
LPSYYLNFILLHSVRCSVCEKPAHRQCSNSGAPQIPPTIPPTIPITTPTNLKSTISNSPSYEKTSTLTSSSTTTPFVPIYNTPANPEMKRIKHVVVLMLVNMLFYCIYYLLFIFYLIFFFFKENRSFDSMLGFLYKKEEPTNVIGGKKTPNFEGVDETKHKNYAFLPPGKIDAVFILS